MFRGFSSCRGVFGCLGLFVVCCFSWSFILGFWIRIVICYGFFLRNSSFRRMVGKMELELKDVIRFRVGERMVFR